MCFTRPGVQTELDRFFKAVSKSPSSFDSISKSAFTQSRRKLKPEAFIELAKVQLDYFEENAPYKKSWKNSRVIAIDGSVLNLPNSEELKSVYGCLLNKTEEGAVAKCSFAYDVCNELIIDSYVGTINNSEQELALRHLPRLNSDTDILVFDRGYPSQWLIGLLMQKGFRFCFRLNSSWKEAYALLEEDKNDIDWVLELNSHKGLKKIKEYNIPLKIAGLRLVSFELPSGEKEVLATNLSDRDTFSLNDLNDLYRMRWGVEESYKSLKKVLNIEYFTGKTALSIEQDFYAKVFMLNMASMIGSQGVINKKSHSKNTTKHKYQPNKTQVLAKTKDFLVDIFYFNRLSKAISQMLKLLCRRFEIIRPHRSFPRSGVPNRRNRKPVNSKGI